jgi:8-oxo-dGTP pyrophosphatase MutT (NUDIX family)
MSLADRLRDALHASAGLPVGALAGDLREEAGIDDGLITPAAVLVPIVDRPDPGVILTLRTDTVRRHAGQIAFPGGRIDPDDDGPVDAALREAEEEIGLRRSDVEVVGTADRYRTITGFDVTPVLGVVPPELSWTLQPSEVADVFEVPLLYVLEPRHHVERSVEFKGRERSFYEIEWQDRRIWGATAAMIVNLSRRLALQS